MPPEVAEQAIPETYDFEFDKESFSGTMIVAVSLCLVCSLLVSLAAVGLKPLQEKNNENKKKRNVLIAAGLWKETSTDADIQDLFKPITPLLVNLAGRSDDAPPAGSLNNDLDASTYNQIAAARDPAQSVNIPADLDLAGIKQREKVGMAYIVKDASGKATQIVLPIYGKGLWSTLYGFLAVDADTRTARGITYYQHAETPGLGGEVENPKWKAQWRDKKLRSDDGTVTLDVVKPGNAAADNVVDGISAATVTSNGVEGMIHYWLGPDGYGPFLDRFSKGEISIPNKR